MSAATRSTSTRWEEEGARGWGFRHVLPYFQRAETRAEGGDAYRGGDGPLHTRYGTPARTRSTAPSIEAGGRPATP